MRFSTPRGLALVVAIPALLVFCVIPGCSNQGEGDRCGSPERSVSKADDADCGDGLVCKAKASLVGRTAHRCCYPDHVTDSRCLPDETAAGGGDSVGGGTASGGAVGGGAADQAAGAGG